VKWWRSGLAGVLGAGIVIIVFRALVYLLFEQVAFDSDQAIVGLMAKHLIQGSAFPLFFYGQTYMLAVESWAAAPFFLIAGPTVVALRVSMLMWNIVFACLLMIGLVRDGGLRPWSAFVAALFFLAAPAAISLQLMTAMGGMIEPFVYIALLWFLRRHPFWFGVVLAIGFRNREFTLYAVPVLLTLELIMGELNRVRLREWLVSIAIFFAVWESIEALKPLADLAGPGTRGQLLGGFAGSQVYNLLERFAWQPEALAERVVRMGPELLAWFAGANQADAGIPVTNRPWLTWTSGVLVALATGRLLFLMMKGSSDQSDRARGTLAQRLRSQVRRAPFAFYILGVGIVAVAAFVAGKPVLNGYSRYVVLGALVPVGLTASVLAVEWRPALRRFVVATVLIWTALSLGDHAKLLASVVRNPPISPNRQIANRLVERRIPVAAAGYWRAYVIAFLAREQVRVASNDWVRIQKYQELFADHLSEAVVISESPCVGGEPVASLYLCKP
jgi:hypothetical protein